MFIHVTVVHAPVVASYPGPFEKLERPGYMRLAPVVVFNLLEVNKAIQCVANQCSSFARWNLACYELV